MRSSSCGNNAKYTSVKSKKKSRKKRFLIAPIIIVFALAIVAVFIVSKNGVLRSDDGELQSAATSSGTSQPAAAGCFSNRYYLNQLSGDELKAAETIYKGVSNFDTAVEVSLNLTDDQLQNINSILHFECPELMQFETLSYVKNESGKIIELRYDYCMERDEYEKKLAAVETVLSDFKAKTDGFSKNEAILFVYNEIALSVAYDKTAPDCGNAYGALVGKQAKCDGFSAAFQWALNSLGYDCSTVTGKSVADGEPHAWNMLAFDGKWYFTDLTSDARGANQAPVPLHAAYAVPLDWIEKSYSIDGLYTATFSCPAVASDMRQSYHVQKDSFAKTPDECVEILKKTYTQSDGRAFEVVIQFSEISVMQEVNEKMQSLILEAIGTSSFSMKRSILDSYNTMYIEVQC